jgi:hypothetical protein
LTLAKDRLQQGAFVAHSRILMFLLGRFAMLRPSMTLALLSAAVLAGLLLAADDKKDDKKDEPKDTPVKVKMQLRQHWKELGLDKDQVNKIYEVQTEYGTKIAQLQKQINELKKKQEQEEFGVLTDTQKARLKEILAAKADPTKKDDKKDDKKDSKTDPAKKDDKKDDKKDEKK